MTPSTAFSPEEALAVVLEDCPQMPVDQVPLSEALGRVLAHPISAAMDQPRFNKAAVDGWGVTDDSADLLTPAGMIAAGDPVDPDAPSGISSGQAIKIMTGAPVPPDVRRLIRVECTQEQVDGRISVLERDSGANIALRGEDVQEGQPLMDPGILRAQDIGILASQGFGTVPVRRKPRVVLLSTGTEVVSAEASEASDEARGTGESGERTPIASHQIFDANGPMLRSLLEENLAFCWSHATISDDPDRIRMAISTATAGADVCIVSGGVSMGDRDFVPEALSALDARIRFHGLAMKPGMPTLFAHLGSSAVFGMPGNPVSTFVQFVVLVAPLLRRMLGLPGFVREASLPLEDAFTRRDAGRHEFRPGVLSQTGVRLVSYHGSGDLSALASANCLIRIEQGVREVPAGGLVRVRRIRPQD